ncbi:GSCOCG00013156001-RA-CDS [Cotesia congregata]|nr:GSCOCG00013156001-RA-CDS [Cotesia congregata]
MSKFVTFDCAGKINSNDTNLTKTAGLMKEQLDRCKELQVIDDRVLLFDHELPGAIAILHLQPLIECVEMNLRILTRYEKYNPRILETNSPENLYQLRKSVCDFLTYTMKFISSVDNAWFNEEISQFLDLQDIDRILQVLKTFISRLRTRVPAAIFHYAVSNIGNKCSQPEFHLYHMHLELRWLLILFTYVRASKFTVAEMMNDLSKTLELVIDDLIYISLKIFERHSGDLRLKTPYSCSCARELWLMIQVIIEDCDQVEVSFWEYVNCALDKITPTAKSELFSVWLIYHLGILQGYSTDGVFQGSSSERIKDNYTKIERILRGFSRHPGDVDEELKLLIPLVKKLTTEWWEFRIIIINHLWEYFPRRLEHPYLTSQGLWSLSMDRKTPQELLKQVKERIDGKDAESSYGMFLNFLGCVLKRQDGTSGKKNYWYQIKGRICSKFNKFKVQEFNEAALLNFISLFLTLGVTADVADVCTVMLNLLPPVLQPDNNSKRTILSWKGQLCALLLYRENDLSLQPIADRFVEMVNVICCRQDEFGRSMMSTFIDTLGTLVVGRGDEHLLISGWIDRYLRECPKSKIPVLLKLVLEMLNKDSRDVLATLMVNVVGCLRTMVFSGDYYEDLPKLAVEFTVQAARYKDVAEANRQEASSLFVHFTSTLKVKDARIIKNYLTGVLGHSELEGIRGIKNFNLIVIQAWFKCCIHGLDSSGEMEEIKRCVVQFDEIRQLFTQQEREKFIKESESLISWAMALNNRRRTAQDTALDVRTRSVLMNLDKWVLGPIRPETQDSELAWWIYRCFGTIFLCCGAMMHTKTHASMLLNYINKFVLIKNNEDSYLRHLSKKIFSMVILGLESANAKNDVTLINLVSDLLQAYLPLLVTESGDGFRVAESLTRCFTDTASDFSVFIVEKLAVFLKISQDNSMHKHGYLVMALINHLLDVSVAQNKKYIAESIVLKCSGNIVEAYIRTHEHHPHKQQTAKFINYVCGNNYFKSDFKLRLVFLIVIYFHR